MPAQLSKEGIPFGTIIAFAGEQDMIPRGWLHCKGDPLDRRIYPKLFEAIGTIWGGSGTYGFYLPDLRGLFLRGVSMGTGVDPDAGDRESPRKGEANPGNQKDNVGSIQQDALREHSHSYQGHTSLGAEGHGGNAQLQSTTIQTGTTGGKETRPVNAYIHYIIKCDDQLGVPG